MVLAVNMGLFSCFLVYSQIVHCSVTYKALCVLTSFYHLGHPQGSLNFVVFGTSLHGAGCTPHANH